MIRGSHREKALRPHETNDGPGLALNQELPPSEFDESQTVDMEMEAGRISLHDVFLVHGSEPNRSTRPRRGMTLRFMPTSSHYDRDIERRQFAASGRVGDPRRPLFLMRGVDVCGKNDYEASFAGR